MQDEVRKYTLRLSSGQVVRVEHRIARRMLAPADFVLVKGLFVHRADAEAVGMPYQEV